MPISFLPMKNADLDACARIISDTPFFQNYGYPGEKARSHLLTALVEGADELVVAHSSGKVAAFAWFVKNGAFARSGYLRLIAVDPASHLGGVGRALMTELERKFLSPNGLFLLVTSSNLDARKFYEKLGYRQVGEIPNFVKAGLSEAIYFRPASG